MEGGYDGGSVDATEVQGCRIRSFGFALRVQSSRVSSLNRSHHWQPSDRLTSMHLSVSCAAFASSAAPASAARTLLLRHGSPVQDLPLQGHPRRLGAGPAGGLRPPDLARRPDGRRVAERARRRPSPSSRRCRDCRPVGGSSRRCRDCRPAGRSGLVAVGIILVACPRQSLPPRCRDCRPGRGVDLERRGISRRRRSPHLVGLRPHFAARCDCVSRFCIRIFGDLVLAISSDLRRSCPCSIFGSSVRVRSCTYVLPFL